MVSKHFIIEHDPDSQGGPVDCRTELSSDELLENESLPD
jgi:hypothetical protein